MRSLIIIILASLAFLSCSKKGTLDTDYWCARLAGTYEVQSVQYKKYINNDLIYDSTQTFSNTLFLLYSTDGDGFGHPMDIYGTWLPSFLTNVNATGFAWNVENDNKRITLGHFDPSTGYTPDQSLTVDNMKRSTQHWHYLISYISGTNDIYYHQIITVKRREK